MTKPDLVRNPRKSPWGHGLQAAQQRLTAAEIQHAVECAQQCVDLVCADERGTAKLASFYARQLDHSTLMMRIEPDQGSSISSRRGRPSRFSASRRHSRLANYPSRPAGLIRGSTLRAEGRGRVDESGLPRPLGAKHADKLIATSSQRNVGEDCSPTERQRAVSEFSDAHGAFDNARATAFSSPIIQSWKVVPAGFVSVTPTTGIFASWAIRTMRCAAASLAWLL
jgi:hypothetical protein